MTARERIRAAECEYCAKGDALFNHPTVGWIHIYPEMSGFKFCTAPSNKQIIERLARDLERLLFALGCQLAGVEGALTVIEAKNSAIAGIEHIAAALSLPPEAGVEEIVERAKEAAEDTVRMDWLEGEMDREKLRIPIPPSLFRRNVPIKRAALDAARRQG